MKTREYYELKIEAAKLEIKKCKQALRLYDKLDAMEASADDVSSEPSAADLSSQATPDADAQMVLPAVAADALQEEPSQSDKPARGKKTA